MPPSKVFALLVVGPDVIGGSQRCEVEISPPTCCSLEYLAKELESQIQFSSPNCMISLIEIFDYNRGQYVPLQDIQRQLEDRARLRVRCARNSVNISGSHNDRYDDGMTSYKTSSSPFQYQQNQPRRIDRELDSKAEDIRKRASSPEALQRFKSTTPDYGGAVGRATMIGKPLPASSALPTSLIDGNTNSAGISPLPTPRGGGNNNNNKTVQFSSQQHHSVSGQSRASSRHSDATSLDQARRVSNSMSYLNGPTNRPSVYNEGDYNHSYSSTNGDYSPQRHYQLSLIQNYQKQQTQNYQAAEDERKRTMMMTNDNVNNTAVAADRFHQAATRSMNSHQPHFSPPQQQRAAANTAFQNNNSHVAVSSSSSSKIAQPETITIFCVYNGPDGQRAKAISINRRRPDLNQVLTTLESKFQLPLCLGYIDPDSGDCEEVRSQQQFAQILNDRSHMHDPNAGCTFHCWMRVEDQMMTPQQKFEKSRNQEHGQSAAAARNNAIKTEHEQEQQQNDISDNNYYSPNNQLHRSSPGRHDAASAACDEVDNGVDNNVVSPMSNNEQQQQQVRQDPPHYSPNNTSRTSTNNNSNNDPHRFNRHATISPTKQTTPRNKNQQQQQNTATKISQYALQRLQALEAEQARRNGGGNTPGSARPTSARNRGDRNAAAATTPGSVGPSAQRHRPMDTRSMISVVSAAPSTVMITEDQLRDTFDELDLEGSGFVTKAAMRHWFDKNVDTMGVPGSDKKFEKMLATAKRRHDLDYQEFCVVMLKIAQW